MSERDVRRFVADLLRGRRPRAFRVEDDDEADQLRAAIVLRAARPGSGAPREEFVTDLHRRLAGELARDAPHPEAAQNAALSAVPPPAGIDRTRRRLVQAASIAASAAAIGAGLDHVLTTPATAPTSGDGGDQTLIPNTGQWRTVAASTDLPEGGIQGFDVGTVIGFVTRGAGQLGAVSGVCTHLGCQLALNAPARRLDCPCHNASFALGGQVLRHQLAIAPAALPHVQVRETDGMVQIFAPPIATA